MPSDWTSSASAASDCAVSSARMLAAPASAIGPAVDHWLRSASATRTRPPPTARRPSSGWKRKIAARKNGVQGASKRARNTGEAMSRCTASRSRSGLRMPAPPGVAAARRRWAENTRSSSAPWKRAPTRAMTRPRAWSRSPIIAKRNVTSTESASSVSSEREARTRS